MILCKYFDSLHENVFSPQMIIMECSMTSQEMQKKCETRKQMHFVSVWSSRILSSTGGWLLDSLTITWGWLCYVLSIICYIMLFLSEIKIQFLYCCKSLQSTLLERFGVWYLVSWKTSTASAASTDEWEDHALVVSHLAVRVSNNPLDRGYFHAITDFMASQILSSFTRCNILSENKNPTEISYPWHCSHCIGSDNINCVGETQIQV